MAEFTRRSRSARGAYRGAAALVACLAAMGAVGVAPSASAAPTTSDETSQGPELGPSDVRDRRTAALRAAFDGAGGAAATEAAQAAGHDPLLRDLLEWARLREAQADVWGELSTFIARRPLWPDVSRLRARAEAVMPESTSPRQVLSFFRHADPVTGRGGRLLGQALIAFGRIEDGRTWIVRAWRETPMPRAEEELFLELHDALLEQHHDARAQSLFWRERLTAAQRLTKRLSEGQRALLAAQTALLRRRGDVDRLVTAVPASLQNDPGLAYARMQWRSKKKRHDEAEALILETTERGPLGDPAAWASSRLYYAREAYEDGRPADAYALATGHGLRKGVDFADLEWFAGWIALRHLRDPRAALARFETMWLGVRSPISRGRAAYWAGEAAAALGDADAATEWRWRAAANPHVFYGQLATERLRAPAPSFVQPEPSTLPPRDLSADERSLIDAGIALYRLDRPSDARRFLDALADRRDDPQTLRYLAALADAFSDAGGAIRIGKTAWGHGVDLWTALYPIPASPSFADRTRRVEPALLLALARQESAFQTTAASSAGALGLMQMMPRTAKVTAKRNGMRYDRQRLVADPEYNLSLADAHMAELLDAYDGSYVLAVAAYNAGGGNVRKWIERFGDPRDRDVNTVDWIESIPFSETRNYVQRVLEAVQVYRARLGLAPKPVRLASDLAR